MNTLLKLIVLLMIVNQAALAKSADIVLCNIKQPGKGTYPTLLKVDSETDTQWIVRSDGHLLTETTSRIGAHVIKLHKIDKSACKPIPKGDTK